MTTLTMSHHQGQSFLRKHLSKFLMHKVSPRIKRLIFLSSVFSLFENTTTASDATLTKLNSVLKLAHNQDAIAFPMYIRSWLWNECEPQKKILVNGEELSLGELLQQQRTPEVLEKIAAYLMSIAPSWIVYSDNKSIAKDLDILLRRCSTH